MLEEFELAVGAFREDRRAEGFHDLLDGDGCACELVFCRTEQGIWVGVVGTRKVWSEAYHTRPNAPLKEVSGGQAG